MASPDATAVLFTQQFVGQGTRKTGMVFWAEALARHGFDTHVVSTQLSWLSLIGGRSRLNSIRGARFNSWQRHGPRLSGFIWMPAFHPASVSQPALRRLTEPVFAYYPKLLPRAVREKVKIAKLIVIESCAAVLLFEELRRLAPPDARFVYCASDRLTTVGMNPMLSRALDRTAERYDLIRVPARMMANDFPASAPVSFIPHGVDKAEFDRRRACPFEEPGPHAIVAGEMLFDRDVLGILLEAFPRVSFHAFGRMDVEEFRSHPNLFFHGEVPFETLAAYLLHADVGLAPYRDRAEAHYLAESSLKLLQYTYCRLPTVAPHFATAGHPHIIGYTPGDADSIRAAMAAALDYPRASIHSEEVMDWNSVIADVVAKAGLQQMSAA